MSYAEIKDYIDSYNPISPNQTVKVTVESIRKLKNRKQVYKMVPRLEETLDFVKFVKVRFPSFDEDSFFATR